MAKPKNSVQKQTHGCIKYTLMLRPELRTALKDYAFWKNIAIKDAAEIIFSSFLNDPNNECPDKFKFSRIRGMTKRFTRNGR